MMIHANHCCTRCNSGALLYEQRGLVAGKPTMLWSWASLTITDNFLHCDREEVLTFEFNWRKLESIVKPILMFQSADLEILREFRCCAHSRLSENNISIHETIVRSNKDHLWWTFFHIRKGGKQPGRYQSLFRMGSVTQLTRISHQHLAQGVKGEIISLSEAWNQAS